MRIVNEIMNIILKTGDNRPSMLHRYGLMNFLLRSLNICGPMAPTLSDMDFALTFFFKYTTIKITILKIAQIPHKIAWVVHAFVNIFTHAAALSQSFVIRSSERKSRAKYTTGTVTYIPKTYKVPFSTRRLNVLHKSTNRSSQNHTWHYSIEIFVPY